MAKIYLVRHGQDEDNEAGRLNGRRDMPLTPRGVAQARNAGEILQHHQLVFAAIYHSPLQRTRQTALAIAEMLTCDLMKVFTIPDLIERDFGIMTGKGKEQILGLCPEVLQTERINYFLSGDGIETFPQTLIRVQRVLNELRTRHMNEDILVASHGDVITMLIAAHYGLPWERVLTSVHVDNADIIVLPHNPGAFDEKDLLLR